MLGRLCFLFRFFDLAKILPCLNQNVTLLITLHFAVHNPSIRRYRQYPLNHFLNKVSRGDDGLTENNVSLSRGSGLIF